jgi:hypothetical protein
MQLLRREKAEWRLETQRKLGIPFDPKYIGIHQYECGICNTRYFYNGDSDPDTPQVHTKRRTTKLGYGIGIQVCHDCWHEKGYENPLVNHSSKCRVCELRKANLVAQRRAKAESKLREEESKTKRSQLSYTRPLPRVREQDGNGSSIPVPSRRSSLRHKKKKRSR